MTAHVLAYACLLFLCPLFGGCDPAEWDGKVQRWGSVRKVVQEGATAGRVRISDVLDKPHAFGLGAAEALRGEIIIIDGEAWIAEAAQRDPDKMSVRKVTGEKATFLAVAHVPDWFSRPVETDLRLQDLDEAIRSAAAEAGIEAETIPFVIEGPLAELKMHVINGNCPHRASILGEGLPIATSLTDTRGILVGFWTNEPPGVLTHLGSKTHVHVLLSEEDRRVGHVDEVLIRAGATLRLPGYRKPGEQK